MGRWDDEVQNKSPKAHLMLDDHKDVLWGGGGGGGEEKWLGGGGGRYKTAWSRVRCRQLVHMPQQAESRMAMIRCEEVGGGMRYKTA